MDVSIIFPIRIAGAKLDRAMNSVLTQWYGNVSPSVEVVFVNDDIRHRVTKQKLSSWVQRLKRDKNLQLAVTLVKHLRHKGFNEARNSGSKVCTGKYICYMTCNDIYFPNRIREGYLNLSKYSDADISLNAYEKYTWQESNLKFTKKTTSDDHLIGLMHTRNFYTRNEKLFPDTEHENYLAFRNKFECKIKVSSDIIGRCHV